MNSMKKVLALVMVCLMVVSLIPMSAFAEHEEAQWTERIETRQISENEQKDVTIHYCKDDECSNTEKPAHPAHDAEWGVDEETNVHFCIADGCTIRAEHFDEDDDGNCDVCKFTIPAPMVEPEHEWIVDETTKEHKCSVEDCTEGHKAHPADWNTSAEESTCKYPDCTITCAHTDGFSVKDTNEHKCNTCFKVFAHEFDNTGKCGKCDQYHDHDGNWDENGVCKVCHYVCEHDSHDTDGKCTVCGKTGIAHTYVNGSCVCGKTCSHPKSSLSYKNCGYHHCGICQADVAHTIADGKCTVCGNTVEAHTHGTEAKCSVCGLDSPHEFEKVEGDYTNHKCKNCTATEAHSPDADGTCTVCGQTKKPVEYKEYELADGSTVELNVTLNEPKTVNQGSSNLGGLSTGSENVSFSIENLKVPELIKQASALGAVFANQSDVAINFTTKVQPGDVMPNANGEVEYLPFTVTPSIEIKGKTINGSDVNDYLDGTIEVVLPVGTLKDISGIRHISDTMPEETLSCVPAEAKQTVTFNVSHFSEFDVLTDPTKNVVVASCGTLLFTELQAALDYASTNSGTVKMLADVTEPGKTYIVDNSTKNVTLALNNRIIESSGTVLDVFSKNFTVTDTSGAQGTINSTDGDALYLNSGAAVTITGGLIHNDGGSDAAVYVAEGAALNVTGGKISAVSDYAVESYGTVTIKGSDTVVMSETKSAINNGGTLTVESGNINFDGQPTTDAADDIVGSGTTSVSGGKFGHAVPENQCAADYMPTPNQTEAPFTVTPMSQVKAAKLVVNGETNYFNTLQDAIIAVNVDGTVDISNVNDHCSKPIPNAKSVVTLLTDVAENIEINLSNIQNGFVIDADGHSICKSAEGATAAGTITVLAGTVELRGFNQAGDIKVASGATAFITSGVYRNHGGENDSSVGTYVISGSNTVDAPSVFPAFADKVKDTECYAYWKVNETKRDWTKADSFTRYIPNSTSTVNSVKIFKPSITSLSANYIYYKSSTQYSPSTLVIHTDGDYADLVMKDDTGTVFKCLKIGSVAYDQYGNSGSTLYYKVDADNNGKAVITINSNGIKKWFNYSGTRKISVQFVTGETDTKEITVGSTVKTGDASNIILWAGIMAASLVIVGCGGYIVIRKSRKRS